MADFQSKKLSWDTVWRVLDVVERIWKIIRPAASTRITWLVVGAGVSLFATPIWEPILVATLTAWFGFKIAELPGPGWGLALILIGLTYHLIITLTPMVLEHLLAQRTSARNRVHDQTIVERLLAEFPQQDFQAFIGAVGDGHAYLLHDNRQQEFAAALRDPANAFLDKPLADAAEALAVQSSRLSGFLARYFSPYGNFNPMRLVLLQDLNSDLTHHVTAQQAARYDDVAHELHALLDDVERTYDEFIRLSHHRTA